MYLAFQRTKVYLRLVLMAGLAAVVLLTLWMNRDHHATVWFFKEFKDINVLSLMASTASGTLIAWRIAVVASRVFGDLQELRKHEKELEQQRQQEQFAKKIAEHEEKLGTQEETQQ